MTSIPTAPDLSGLDFGALKALRDRIDDRVREMRVIEGPPCGKLVLREKEPDPSGERPAGARKG